jgi:hypothetical protein
LLQRARLPACDQVSPRPYGRLGDKVNDVGKRWNNPDYISELLGAEGGPDLIEFWRSPVFRLKFYNVPTFLLPRLSEMAEEHPSTDFGRTAYYERVHCLLVLASISRDTDPTSFLLNQPPTDAERELGIALGQAFHKGCSLVDIALASGLPPDQVVAIGKRTIRRTEWLTQLGVPTARRTLRMPIRR